MLLRYFFKHPNKVKFKNLDESEVLSSDFPGLRISAGWMTSTASTTSVVSMTFAASFHQKNYWFWWLHHPWHQNDQRGSLIVKWVIKNPNFHWYLNLFCRRLLRPADVTFLKTGWWNSNVQTSWTRYEPQFNKLLILLPLRPFTLDRFNMRHPVIRKFTFSKMEILFR